MYRNLVPGQKRDWHDSSAQPRLPQQTAENCLCLLGIHSKEISRLTLTRFVINIAGYKCSMTLKYFLLRAKHYTCRTTGPGPAELDRPGFEPDQ